VFVVYPEGIEPEPSETVSDVSAPAAEPQLPQMDRPTDVHGLDFKSVGIATWKVKTSIGLVYDFSDFKTLRKYLQEGRVSQTDALSHDGSHWTPIGEVKDLETHFIDVFVAAHGARPAATTAPPQSASAETADDDDSIADQLLAALEASAEEEASGIELDMDSLLEAASKSAVDGQGPASARRGSEAKAVEKLAQTGNEESTGHQFIDPFEALKQTRKSRGRLQGTRVSKKAAAAAVEAGAKQRKQMIMVALLLCATGLYFGIDRTVDDGRAEAVLANEQKIQAEERKKASLKKRGEEARARMEENLNAALKEVKKEDMAAFTIEEDQLIVLVPKEFQKGPPGDGSFSPPSFRDLADYAADALKGKGALSLEDHVSMGDAASRSGRYEDAAVSYKLALEAQPTNAVLRARLGHALFKGGNIDAAELELRTALSAGAVSAHKYLGHMAKEQGDISGANSHYQSYLRSAPPDARAIEIMIKQMTP
jgi:tetratricopeptide (TPR) repeat protein